MITILVVEDDEKLNRIVCARLSGAGYNPISCSDPYEAFDVMASAVVDLVISDIMMPRMDGFEFAELVRRQNDSVPILFMSARDDLSAKQRGFRLGMDDYMVKPIDLDELLMRVGALLRRCLLYTSGSRLFHRFRLSFAFHWNFLFALETIYH